MIAFNTSVGESQPPTRPAPAHMRRTLLKICRSSLARFKPPDGSIIARSLVWTNGKWDTTEPSPLDTAEVLKALLLMQAQGLTTPFDPIPVLNTLIQSHLDSETYQVVSLALWGASIGKQRSAHRLWSLLRARVANDASQSMPLAWALSALCHYAPMAQDHREVSEFTHGVFQRLIANQSSATGLFHGSARREGWLRRRRPDATLSTQIYPILALASFAQRFTREEALERAVRCAGQLCALQGELGQWWRRYDAMRGTVLETYPVYCVNQDGAVPSALGELQNALGDNRYQAAIDKGLSWEFGANEMGVSLVDESAGVVARCIDSYEGSLSIDRELYAYQPARCIVALLSNPRWAAEVSS